MLRRRVSISDMLVTFVSYATAIFAIVIILYPFTYITSMSISEQAEAAAGNVWLFPKGFSLEAYKSIFRDGEIWIFALNSVYYTVVGTLLSLIVTTLAAYPLSRRDFYFRNFVMILVIITMFFSGGLIPFFIVVTRLGMIDTRSAIILPALVNSFNLVICRTYMQSIPEEMHEAAKIDGARPFKIFCRIIVPLSKPMIAVLAIFYGVGNWNSFFSALLFLRNPKLFPLQLYLRRILIQASPEILQRMASFSAFHGNRNVFAYVQLKYAVVMVVVVPIICIYPFLQKHFEKGLMIGSLKG